MVSLREFAADRIEDWMALGIYDASAASAVDVMVAAPKSLDRVAVQTDKGRARICNADGPCVVDEDAWARHAQEIRLAYDEVKIQPRIAHILQSPGAPDSKPYVDWPESLGKTYGKAILLILLCLFWCFVMFCMEIARDCRNVVGLALVGQRQMDSF